MDDGLFAEVADVVAGLLPVELAPVRQRPRRWGIKVWFGPAAPPREHYEAQVVSADADETARTLVLEIGFHAEHPQATENDAVLDRLLVHERRWRRVLGRAPVAGPFLGRADTWRRISETWPDPDLSVPGVGFEIGARLVDYVSALEPLRRA